MISGAHVTIEAPTGTAGLAHALNAAVAGSPFTLAATTARGSTATRCTFVAARPGMALGYGNLIDLQHRLTRSFDLVAIERITTLDQHARLAS